MVAQFIPSARQRIMTFGIELEFIIIIRKKALIAWNEQRGIGREETELHRNQYMKDYLAILLSTCDKDPYNPAHLPVPPYTWENMSLGPVMHTEPKKCDYRFWSICKEASVGVFTSDILRTFGYPRHSHDAVQKFDRHFWYEAAELVSSVLCIEAAFQWELQLERINKLLHAAPADAQWIPRDINLLCMTPRSACCGLHVHIGYGAEDIPWRVVQTIYILWGIYEKEIEELQPIERRASRNVYAHSLRGNCQPFTYRRYAQGIMRTQTPQQLKYLLTCSGAQLRNLKIGISEARGDGMSPGSKRQTLEFREGLGSVDNVNIMWWIKFIEAVVRFAQSLVDINFDLIGDLYDTSAGRPGLLLCESIFDHISIVTLNQQGRNYFETALKFWAGVPSPSIGSDDDDTP